MDRIVSGLSESSIKVRLAAVRWDHIWTLVHIQSCGVMEPALHIQDTKTFLTGVKWIIAHDIAQWSFHIMFLLANDKTRQVTGWICVGFSTVRFRSDSKRMDWACSLFSLVVEKCKFCLHFHAFHLITWVRLVQIIQQVSSIFFKKKFIFIFLTKFHAQQLPRPHR